MVSLQLQQDTSIGGTPDKPLYVVTQTVSNPVNNDGGVFVYKTIDQTFNHFATVVDLEAWPLTYEAAVIAALDFYRLPTLQRGWSTIDEMQDDLTISQSRIRRMLEQLDALQGANLPSSNVVVLSAGE